MRSRYTAQVVGQSPDGAEWWLNWVIRLQSSGEPVGYVQASVEEQDGARVAEVAWVVGVAHQGQGLAVEAAAAMLDWLAGQHEASMRVAARLGLERTERWQDGELRWERRL